MKELLIIFLLALALGAYINGVNQTGPTPLPPDRPADQSQSQSQSQGQGQDTFAGTGSETSGQSTASNESRSNSGTVTELAESDFQDKVIKSGEPVFVDFYATWCGPCRRMEPVINKLAQDYKGKVTFYKVDVDRNQSISSEYKVDSLPTYVLFVGGSERGRTLGAQDPSGLVALLDKR